MARAGLLAIPSHGGFWPEAAGGQACVLCVSQAYQPLPAAPLLLPHWLLGLGQASADHPYHGLPIARVRPAPLPLDRPKPPLLLESLLGLTPRKDESQ